MNKFLYFWALFLFNTYQMVGHDKWRFVLTPVIENKNNHELNQNHITNHGLFYQSCSSLGSLPLFPVWSEDWHGQIERSWSDREVMVR